MANVPLLASQTVPGLSYQLLASHNCNNPSVFHHCRGNNVSTELLPNNGCCTVACLPSCYLAMGLHVTLLLLGLLFAIVVMGMVVV
jgi:hypothetical protein